MNYIKLVRSAVAALAALAVLAAIPAPQANAQQFRQCAPPESPNAVITVSRGAAALVTSEPSPKSGGICAIANGGSVKVIRIVLSGGMEWAQVEMPIGRGYLGKNQVLLLAAG
jgi:hypothetical protein